jgi:hypothetical protein
MDQWIASMQQKGTSKEEKKSPVVQEEQASDQSMELP